MKFKRERLIGSCGCQIGEQLGHDGDSCRANRLSDDGVFGEAIACYVCGRVYPRLNAELLTVTRAAITAYKGTQPLQAPQVLLGAATILHEDAVGRQDDDAVREFCWSHGTSSTQHPAVADLVRIEFIYGKHGGERVGIYYQAREPRKPSEDDPTIGEAYSDKRREVPETLDSLARLLEAQGFRVTSAIDDHPVVTMAKGTNREPGGLLLYPRIMVTLCWQPELL